MAADGRSSLPRTSGRGRRRRLVRRARLPVRSVAVLPDCPDGAVRLLRDGAVPDGRCARHDHSLLPVAESFVRHVWWLMAVRPAQGCRAGRDSTVELCGGDRTRCIGHPAPADGTATDPPQLESGGVASGIFRNGSPRGPLQRVLSARRNHRAYRVVVSIAAHGLFRGSVGVRDAGRRSESQTGSRHAYRRYRLTLAHDGGG